ncbi:MAG TPA: hypothetical protein VJ461_05010 [Candidatus Nanoarchaeia archaeon]|nr:hypothetical protein [Candidatus Nanoarchaeia archaeon]
MKYRKHSGKYSFFPIESLYPTPEERLKSAKPGSYEVGSMVKVLIGPAKGRIGVVLVDRNANYSDYEPYAGKESIGVAVVEKESLDKNLEARLLEEGFRSEDFSKTVIRWFDGPDQLELARKPSGEYIH